MNEQVLDLKFQKRINHKELQLVDLFNAIVKYNPPNVNKIDPRYACFEELEESVVEALHGFLIQLKDEELRSLTF
jgi:hypothetical protein